ncbi:MAG: HAD family phosphatase [Armatimonadetes bacterium]|nr:HAD family phosphatase [Armatimonadota bacterium]
MRYRMLVADIDGTLVDPRLRIPEGVRASVKEAQARGVRVLLATGRIWPSARRFYEALGADPPAILYNGGLVYDFTTGRVLFRDNLPAAHARTVFSLVREFPDVQPHVFMGDRMYVGRMNEITDAYRRKDELPVEETGDLLAFVEAALGRDAGAVGKIMVIGPRAPLLAFSARLSAVDPAVSQVFSEHTYCEILPPGVSKGRALRLVASALGVLLAEVIAVGDNFNDLDMIEAAGLGVAMGNAPEALRARADFVCPPTEEEGLREVIERFVLRAPARGSCRSP